MKRLAASLLVAASAALAPLASAADEVNVHIDGIGGMKCTSILTGMKNEPAKAANAVLGWTFGYMARRNIERGVAGLSQVEYSKVGGEKVLNVVLSFCEKNADARLFEIADAFYTVLLQESAPAV